jgi:two-component system sensor histidine kinase/response regulator
MSDSRDELPPSTTMEADKVNILLVDDQPGKLLAHESILSELGQNVVKARNGREALECLLKQDFAVILLDVNMPEIGGFETAELIRQRPRFEKTPIIFVTGYNTTDIDRLRGYSLGAVDYLFLPIIPEVLKAKVSVFVELARQTQLIKRQALNLAEHNEAQARQLEVIQRLNQDLQEANKELEAFSYTISHDLRAPLRSLKGYADILLEDYAPQLDDTAKGYLGSVKRAALRLDTLTSDLLSYTRVLRQTVELEPVSVEKIINDVIALNPALKTNTSELVVAPNLPNVLAHSTLLMQSLGNLLDNASKFVRPGAKAQIRIYSEATNERIKIIVEDKGLGIEPAFHEKIFGIFERVGDLKSYDGTGIGLAIVARAAQKMNGEVGVESRLGEGSRFWLELGAVKS